MTDVISRFRDECRNTRGLISVIARDTGIKVKTLRNIYYGVTKNTGHDKAQQLQAWFERRGTQ